MSLMVAPSDVFYKTGKEHWPATCFFGQASSSPSPSVSQTGIVQIPVRHELVGILDTSALSAHRQPLKPSSPSSSGIDLLGLWIFGWGRLSNLSTRPHLALDWH